MGHSHSDSTHGYEHGRGYSAYGWVAVLLIVIIFIIVAVIIFSWDKNGRSYRHQKKYGRFESGSREAEHKPRSSRCSSGRSSRRSSHHSSRRHSSRHRSVDRYSSSGYHSSSRSASSHPQVEDADIQSINSSDYSYSHQNGSSRFSTSSSFEVNGSSVYVIKLPEMHDGDGQLDNDSQFKYNMDIKLSMHESYLEKNDDGSDHLRREHNRYHDHFSYDSYMEPRLTPVDVSRQSRSKKSEVRYQLDEEGHLLVFFRVDDGIELQCTVQADIHMTLEPHQQLGHGFSIQKGDLDPNDD